MGATSGGFFFWIFLFLACFQMGFYFVTTGWIFEIGLLCVNSINQNQTLGPIIARSIKRMASRFRSNFF